MSKNRCSSVVLAVVWFLLSACCVYAESFPVKDFLSSLSKLNKRYAAFSGSMTSSTTPGSLRDIPQDVFSFQTTANYPNVLYTLKVNEGSPEVWGINKSYYFHLAQTEEHEWQIQEVAPLSFNGVDDWPFAKVPTSTSHLEKTPGNFVRNGFLNFNSIAGFEVARLFELPEFKPIKFETFVEDGVQKASLEFEYEPEDPSPYIQIRSGKVTFLPDSFWVLEKAEVWGSVPGDDDRWIIQIENTFDVLEDGFPLIRTNREAVLDGDKNKAVRFTHLNEYDISPKTETSSSYYTLSSYGFPEPDFGSSRVGLARLIMTAVGALAILLGLWNFYRRRSSGAGSVE